MATYTTTADANGNFEVDFPAPYNGGQQVNIQASLQGSTATAQAYAPSSYFGITDGDITTWSGRNQEQENKAFVTSVEDYSDLSNLNADDGRVVFIKKYGKSYKLDNATEITDDSLYIDGLGRKWVGEQSTHKTTNDYGLKPLSDQINDAFNDNTYVEIPSGKYPTLLNSNAKAYSFGLATPKQKSPQSVVNVVDNADEIGLLSAGNSTAQRWDLAFGYAQKTNMSYHPFPSGFYIMPDYTFYYVWHKPDTGYTATLVKKTMANVIVSEVNFPDTAPQGETFTILNNKMYVGGRLQDPRLCVYDATTGVQEDYFLWGGITFSSRQFAYLDPLDQDRIIVFARKSGIGFGIFEYDLTKFNTSNGIKTLILQKELSIPDFDESINNIQGFTAIGQTAYLVSEVIGASVGQRTKQLYTYRLTDGKLIEVKKFNPNGLYRANARYGDASVQDGNYESEGLCAQINSSNGKASVNLFSGLITGTGADTGVTKFRYLVFKSCIGGGDSMTPVVQGLPIRGGSNSATPTGAGGYIQQYYITLHKINGSWQVQQDNYENSVGLHTVQRVAIEDFNGTPVLAFYLLNVFLTRLYGACSSNRFDFRALLDRNSYGGSTGGATSSRQVVVFADNTGALVSPSSVPDGTKIEISLTVISG